MGRGFFNRFPTLLNTGYSPEVMGVIVLQSELFEVFLAIWEKVDVSKNMHHIVNISFSIGKNHHHVNI